MDSEMILKQVQNDVLVQNDRFRVMFCAAAGIEAIAPKRSGGLHAESPVAAQIIKKML